jgi:hypothetical protein
MSCTKRSFIFYPAILSRLASPRSVAVHIYGAHRIGAASSGQSGGRGPTAPPHAAGGSGSGAAVAAMPSATWTPALERRGKQRTATTVRRGGPSLAWYSIRMCTQGERYVFRKIKCYHPRWKRYHLGKWQHQFHPPSRSAKWYNDCCHPASWRHWF